MAASLNDIETDYVSAVFSLPPYPSTEVDQQSSHSIAIGDYGDGVVYPPILAAGQENHSNVQWTEMPPGENPFQTGRCRNNSDSSGTHSPKSENSPVGSAEAPHLQECVTSKRSATKYRLQTARCESQNSSALPANTFQEMTNPVLSVPAMSAYNDIPTSNIATEVNPRYPQYCNRTNQLESLNRYTHPYPTRDKLERSTLFYKGNGDILTCFICGGDLKDWQPDDDPQVEHDKYFPLCGKGYYYEII